jgi:hypothetical protein
MGKPVAAFVGLVMLSLVVAACSTPAEEPPATGYVDVTAAEAKALIDENPDLLVIDVSPAYAVGHLPGAVNCPVGNGSLDEAIPALDKNAAYLV